MNTWGCFALSLLEHSLQTHHDARHDARHDTRHDTHHDTHHNVYHNACVRAFVVLTAGISEELWLLLQKAECKHSRLQE